jgi:glyoxylate reductase
MSEKVDAEFLDAAGPALRVVANFAVGYDNIDLAACTARGVRATNTPGVLTDATADIAWTLILACARHAIVGDRLVRSGQWRGWAPTQLLGLQLAGATLGVVGAGRIGTAVARRGLGFGMQVVYYARREMPEIERVADARRVELAALLSSSDVVSLHVPLTPRTKHLIDRPQLDLMKRTAVLINTARGPVVNEAALVEALRERRLAGAGFDVYEHEPRLTPGLAALDNVVVLPHLGSGTVATREKMSRMTAENIIAVLEGRQPPNPLN